MILEKNIGDYIDKMQEMFPTLKKRQIKKIIRICSNEIINKLNRGEDVAISSYSKVMTINQFLSRDTSVAGKQYIVKQEYSKRLFKYNKQINNLRKYERSQ